MSSKAMRQAAIKGAKRWKQLRFETLNDTLLPSTHQAELRLPIHVGSGPSASTSSSAAACSVLRLDLSTNVPGVLARVGDDVDGPFLVASASGGAQRLRSEAREDGAVVVAEGTLNVHAGAPKDLGFPAGVEMESQNWMDGVMRGEHHAYAHVGDVVERDDGSFVSGHRARYGASTRWLDQLLLDGFVSRRVDARTGYTTPSVLQAHEHAHWFGKQLPPFHMSPYYGANELLSAWCLFAQTTAELFESDRAKGASSASKKTSSTTARHGDHHVHRATELALAAAVLPSLQSVWLHGALLTHPRTGEVVWITGPRRSGKTTLALHALAAMPELQLTASETFWMAPGPVSSHWGQPLFFASVPAPVEVGLGAVLGTLHPNPALATAVQEHHTLPTFTQTEAGMAAFLRNSDAQVWNMSVSYPVALSTTLPGVRDGATSSPSSSRWTPAVAGRLKAVVLLDWDVEALHSTSPAVATSRVGRAPLTESATWAAFQQSFADHRELFKGHYLIRSVYDDTPEAVWQRLEVILRGSQTLVESPELCVLTGAVSFQRAVDVIHAAFHKN